MRPTDWATQLGPGRHHRAGHLVLHVIAEHASPRGTDSYPSVSTIVDRLAMSRSTVLRALAWLEENGYIEEEVGRLGKNGKPIRGRGYSVAYRMPGMGDPEWTPKWMQRPEVQPTPPSPAPEVVKEAPSGGVPVEDWPHMGGVSGADVAQSDLKRVANGEFLSLYRNLTLTRPELRCSSADAADDGSAPVSEVVPAEEVEVLPPPRPAAEGEWHDEDPGDGDPTEDTDEFDPVVHMLCDHLADWIARNDDDHNRPEVTRTWLVECERLIRIDKRDPQKIRRCIDWCQQNEFWRSNVLSMPKLRKQYRQLQQRAKAESRPRRGVAAASGISPHIIRLMEEADREEREAEEGA